MRQYLAAQILGVEVFECWSVRVIDQKIELALFFNSHC